MASLLHGQLEELTSPELTALRKLATAALQAALSSAVVIDRYSSSNHHTTDSNSVDSHTLYSDSQCVIPPTAPALKLTEIVPVDRAFGEVRHWSVGVTTAPRIQSVLETCLNGIVQAGWNDVHLFLDGTVRIPPAFGHLTTSWREQSVGASTAWYLALAELVALQPQADAYLIFQDDVLVHWGDALRQYLELALWPAAKPGLVSLYTPGLISQRGWHRIPPTWDWGTLAIIFPNVLAKAYLSDPEVVRNSLPTRPGEHRPIPEIVRKWVRRSRLDVWCPSPSLTQHIGSTSTIWPHAGLSRKRSAPWFSTEDERTLSTKQTLDEFRESAFPCSPGDEPHYSQQVQQGLSQMRQCKAVVCVICRDVGPYLPRTAARIERLGSMFSDYRVIVIENDSIDSTVPFLHAWQARNQRVEVYCERFQSPKFPPVRDLQRATALAQCRNRYVARVRELQPTENFSHAIVLDADLAGGWSYEGIASSFAHQQWDAIGSYGLEHYSLPPQAAPRRWHYDRWAFRAPPDSAAAALLGDHQDPLRRGMPLLEVESCFGGLAAYRIDGLLACEYGGDDCEHVVLHRQLRQFGFDKQFLNPSQIVLRSHLIA